MTHSIIKSEAMLSSRARHYAGAVTGLPRRPSTILNAIIGSFIGTACFVVIVGCLAAWVVKS